MKTDGIGVGGATFSTLLLYRRRILPGVRAELAAWQAAAENIPDPDLRAAALHSVTEKAGNPEATAVFATLAPRRGRTTVLRASVAFQVAVDYLDTLGERPGPDPLRDGLTLHGALLDALDPGCAVGDWYAEHPVREDGGYLGRLVETVRAAVARLPAAEAVLPAARLAAGRCGAGQAHTHLVGVGDSEALRRWAIGLDGTDGYEWWEAAAGGASSVAIHALLALAATPAATAGEAVAVDRAYYPAIGALTVLLDDLADRDADRRAGEHNFLAYYADPEQAVERLTAIAAAAGEATRSLPGARHGAILAGVLAYYLASPSPDGDEESEWVRRATLARASHETRALAGVLRVGR